MTQQFVYDGSQIAVALNGEGQVTNRYLWGPAVDMLLADERAHAAAGENAVRWALGDHLNSVRNLAVWDEALQQTVLANQRQWNAFGQLALETNPSAAAGTPPVETSLFGFTGLPFDSRTGLQHNRARWLDPATHTFLSPDPIADDPHNSYRYAGNSPTKFVDPTGLAKTVRLAMHAKYEDDQVLGVQRNVPVVFEFVEDGNVVAAVQVGHRATWHTARETAFGYEWRKLERFDLAPEYRERRTQAELTDWLAGSKVGTGAALPAAAAGLDRYFRDGGDPNAVANARQLVALSIQMAREGYQLAPAETFFVFERDALESQTTYANGLSRFARHPRNADLIAGIPLFRENSLRAADLATSPSTIKALGVRPELEHLQHLRQTGGVVAEFFGSGGVMDLALQACGGMVGVNPISGQPARRPNLERAWGAPLRPVPMEVLVARGAARVANEAHNAVRFAAYKEELARLEFSQRARWRPASAGHGDELIHHAYSRHPSLATNDRGLIDPALYDARSRANIVNAGSEIHSLGNGRYAAFDPNSGAFTVFSWQGQSGLPPGTPTIHSFYIPLRNQMTSGVPFVSQGVVNLSDIRPK